MFSVMWSEHCSYKSSKQLLRTLPTQGQECSPGRARTPAWWPSVTVWPSPSRSNRTTTPAPSSRTRVPPPASAASCATSSPWARGPVALLDALKFGWPDDHRTRRLVDGVVRGVGGYGNCVGVPDRGRRADLRLPSYTGNPLVNVMCVGRPAGRSHRACDRADAGLAGRAVRLADGPRRHRRRIGAGQRGLRRRLGRDAAQRPDRRSVRRPSC